MITFKEKQYSSVMINKITDKLDQDRIEDYEVRDIVSKRDISVGTDLSKLKIYIPESIDYMQYSIDDWLRKNIRGMRFSLDIDRDLLVLTFKSSINFSQYIKLIEAIIEDEGFCIIYDK